MDLSTSTLPEGWRGRLVEVRNPNTAAPSGELEFTGWCLERHDLCVAKLCAFREKDRNFVNALLGAELVEAAVIGERLTRLPAGSSGAAERAGAWLTENAPARDPGP